MAEQKTDGTADQHGSQQAREPRSQLLQQVCKKVRREQVELPRRSVGPMNFEYKQRNNNGKGCIAKSFQATGRRKIILTSVRLHRRPTDRLNRFG